MLHNRIKFYVGVGEDKDGVRIPYELRQNKLDIANVATAKRFQGYSGYLTRGGWINPEGRLVEEPAMVWEVLTTEGDEKVINYHAKLLGEIFNQSTVLVTREVVITEFVEIREGSSQEVKAA